LPDNRAFSSGLYVNTEFKFFEMFDLVSTDDDYKNELIQEGKCFIKKELKEIAINLWAAVPRLLVGQYKCRVINYTGHSSLMAEKILEKYLDCDIALVWRWDGKNKLYKCSIRKRKDDGSKLDLGWIASVYFSTDKMKIDAEKIEDDDEDESTGSGGGHTDAAGFSVSSEIGFEFIFKNYLALVAAL
jgi:hypothetical protein